MDIYVPRYWTDYIDQALVEPAHQYRGTQQTLGSCKHDSENITPDMMRKKDSDQDMKSWK